MLPVVGVLAVALIGGGGFIFMKFKDKQKEKEAARKKSTTSKKTSSTKKKSTALDKAITSAANTVGREVGKRIVRGLFGNAKW